MFTVIGLDDLGLFTFFVNDLFACCFTTLVCSFIGSLN